MPRDATPLYKWLSIRVTVEVHAELLELAREEHRSLNGTAQEAIERYLRARRGRQPKEGAQDR